VRPSLLPPVALLASAAALAGCASGRTATPPRAVAATAAITPAPTPSPSPSPSPAQPPPPPKSTLPDGTRTLFPGHRVVAFYGPTTGAIPSDELSRYPPEEAADRLQRAAAAYVIPGTPVQPAFELIATIAQSSPGDDGDYAQPYDDATVQRYLDVARRHHLLLLLDVQPGWGNLLAAVRHWEKYLVQPDVGLAIDPEWSLRPPYRPAQRIGSTNAATVNAISDYLEKLVEAHDLPQKLFVVHTFTDFMVTNRAGLHERRRLATVIHLDGFGGKPAKLAKYRDLHADQPWQRNGFKLFYRLDTPLMGPAEVLGLRPRPDLISYQ